MRLLLHLALVKVKKQKGKNIVDAILPRKGSINRAMARRLQDDWARDVGEGHRVFMSLRVDFEPIG